jgi:hypothetical protein
MSENTSNSKNVRDDEIDLLDLFRRMGRTLGRWGNGIGRAFLISVVFMIRRWIPLTLSVILGLVLAIVLRSNMKSFYTSDLILKVNIEPTDEVISYVNRLHSYCLEEGKQHLAEAISLTSAQTDNILDIKASWIIDNSHDGIPDYVDYNETHNDLDTLNVRMTDRFNIRVRIFQPQELSNVRDGIIKFINNEPLFQQKNELRLKQDGEMLTRLEYDILQLDSLQKFKYFEEARNILPKTGSQMIFLQEQKTQLIYTDIYNLYNKKQSLEHDLGLYKGIVTILSDFNIPVQRDNGGLYYAKTFVPVFFLFTLLILIMLANRKKLKEIYHKY